MPSIINATTSTGLVTTADNSGSLQLATNNGTTAVTIDTSQRVGIGTTNPDAKLQAQISQSSATTTDMGANSTLNLANSGTGNGVFNALKFAANQQDMFISSFNNNTQANRRLGFFVGSVAGTATTDERVSIYGNGNFAFDSGYGSAAVAYGCRAWVNFNGTGTVAIRASGNVSSITDNGTGDYTVNFTTAMPDVNYAISGATNEGAPFDNASPARTLQIRRTAPTTTASRFSVTNFGNTNTDVEYVYVQIFR